MSDKVEDFFGTLDDYYPGSKRKRRPIDPIVADKKKKKSEEDSWDASPQVKTLPNGKTVELFSAGSLCQALGRPIVTLRLWERKGYIPRAPYRLRSMVIDGVKKPGWRMYSRAMIETTIKSFESRKLIDAPRIDWNKHTSLSFELMEAWKLIHDQETA
jgi:hypothetical protein